MGLLYARARRRAQHCLSTVSLISFHHVSISGPADQGRSVTLEHSSKICKQAFPPGKHVTVPEWPDVEEVNRRGDFALEYSRLAYIDGEWDPWRYCVS